MISSTGYVFRVFNISFNDIDYMGPSLFDGHLCHDIQVELSENSTVYSNYTFQIDVETGNILKWEEDTGSGGRGITFYNNLI